MRGFWIAAAVAAVVLAGCGGEGGAATTSAESAGPGGTSGQSGETGHPDPCTLLTAADLESVTGLAFGDGVYNDDLSSDSLFICDWAATGSVFATAQVLIVPGAGVYDIQKPSAADALGEVVDVPIPGADAAYETSGGELVGMRIGDMFVQVGYLTLDDVEGAEAMRPAAELAKIVAGNL